MPTKTSQPTKLGVASYVKNVGKSLALVSVEAITDSAPNMRDFLRSNEDYIKSGYSYIKNARSRASKADKETTLSRVFDAVNTGIKNLKDDIKTGNLYNTAREDEYLGKMMDAEFGDIMGGDDFNLDDDSDFEIKSSSKPSASAVALSDSFSKAIGAAASMQSTAIAHSTDIMVGSTRASTKLVLSGMDKMSVSISAGLGSIYSSIGVTNKTLEAQVNNSNQFYAAANELLREQVALMRELVKMQSEVYKKTGPGKKASKLDSVMDYTGNVNIEGYMKNIKKNISSNYDLMGLLDSDPNDMTSPLNMILTMISNPSVLLGKVAATALVPKTLKKSISSLDKAFSTMFSQFITDINRHKNKGGFLGMLASIFGVDIDTKDRMDTSQYDKSAVPFDGVTKQAIIETIPGYLARIEAALTGGQERHYDFSKGRWVNADKIASEYKEARTRAIVSANQDLKNASSSVMYQAGLDEKTKNRLNKSINKMMTQLYKDNGYFRMDKVNGKPAWEYYGFESEQMFDLIVQNLPKEVIRGFAKSNMKAKEGFANTLRGKEGAGSIDRQLFNGAYDDADPNAGKIGSGIKGTGLLSLSKDEDGHNVFWYLREILGNMKGKKKGGYKYSGDNGRNARNRSHHTKAQAGTTTASEESGDDPDPDELTEAAIEKAMKDLEKQKKEADRMNVIGNWLSSILEKSPLGKVLGKFGADIGKVFASPITFVTQMLDKADKSLFKVMFGAKDDKVMKDSEGNEITSVLDYIVDKVKTTFDKVTDFIKEKLGKPLKDFFKPLWDKFGAPIWQDTKYYAKQGWERAKKGAANTFGAAFNKVRKGKVASADEVTGTATPEDAADPGVIQTNAYGVRFVTKRGLTMISPGEMIIPASGDGRVLSKQLAGERRDRSRIIKSIKSGNIGLNAKGTVDLNGMKEQLGQIYKEASPSWSKHAAGGILGGGIGLVAGLNPLLAAAAGAGISIINNSATLQRAIFGEDVVDENGNVVGHKGGFIPKKIQDYFKKAGGDAIDFGVAGGILGLVTGMGPLAGAAIGAGIGFLKNSETVQKYLFGEDGLIGPENKEKIEKFLKKGAPNALVGAGIGILTGPFGLIGNAAIGAGLGLVTSTNTFQELLFGKKDDKDDHGILGAFKEGMLNPAIEGMKKIMDDFRDYAKKNIFDNLKKFFDPFTQMVKNAIQNVGDGVKDHLNDMFEKTIGIPAADWMREKLFKPMTKTVGAIIKLPLNVGKAVVAAPFKALGGIGNNIRMGQIAKGTAYDMTAQQRLDWRKEHGFRAAMADGFGRDNRTKQDEALAGASIEELQYLANIAQSNLSDRETVSKNLGEARSKTGKTISEFFNRQHESGKGNLYDAFGYNNVKTLSEAATRGDMASFKLALKLNGKKLTKEQKEELLSLVKGDVDAVRDAQGALDGFNYDQKFKDDAIQKVLGRKFKSRKDMRNVMRSAQAELKHRTKNEGTTEFDEEEAAPEVQATNAVNDTVSAMHETIKEKAEEHTGILKGILETLKNSAYDARGMVLYGKDEYKKAMETGDEFAKATGKDRNNLIQQLLDRTMSKEEWKANQSAVRSYYNPESNMLVSFDKNGKRLDDKSTTETTKELEEEDRHEEATSKATQETSSGIKAMLEKFFGEKAEKSKEGGLFSKLSTGIGTFLRFLGIGGSAVAKTGLKWIGLAGGVSLLGYASEWFKTDIWPMIKSTLFGTTDENGNTVKEGLLGSLGGELKKIFYGDSDEHKGGIFGWIREKIIDPIKSKIDIFNQTYGGGGRSPIAGFFTDFLLPKFIGGIALSMENIVAPVVALGVKYLPDIVVGLVKGIVKGLKAAILNKGITRDKQTVDNSATMKAMQAQHSASTNTISSSAGLGDSIKSMFSSTDSVYSSSKQSIDYSTLFSSNNASADETYDAEGNHLNKTGHEIMYEKAPGISGLLGAEQSTNQIYYDENGNIALDEYDTYNTTDSILSKNYKAGKRAFLLGLGGKASRVGRSMAKIKGKGIGKGLTKAVTATTGQVVKQSGKALDSANRLGLKLNTFTQKSGIYDDMVKQIVDASGGTLKYGDVLASIKDKGVTKASMDLIKGTDDKALKSTILHSGRDANRALKGMGLDTTGKAIKEVVEESAEGAAKAATSKASKKGISKALGVAGEKLANTSAGKAVKNAATKATDAVKNTKVVKAVTETASNAKGLLATITSKITAFFKEIAENSTIVGLIEKACKKGAGGKKAIREALEKIGKKIASSAIGKATGKALTKIAAAVGKYVPFLNIALYVLDFLHGYDNADTILGVAKGDEYKIGFGQKCLCGLLNLVTANLTLGLVPNDLVIDIIVEFLFPIFGLDATELTAARERADDILDEWNKAHPEETYSNLEDFNNKDKLLTKIKKGVGKAATKVWDGIKTVGGKAWDGIKSAGSAIKDKAVETWDKVKNSKVGQAVGDTWNKAKETGSKIKEGVSNFFKDPLGSLKNAGSALVDKAKETGSKIKEGVSNFVSDPLGSIKNAGSAIIDKVKNSKVGQAVGGVVEKVKNSKVGQAVGNVVDGAKNLITKGTTAIADTAKKTWDGAVDIGTFIKDVTTNVINFALHGTEWHIEDYIKEDDPLGGVKKVIYNVMKVPMAVVGAITKVGSSIFNWVKGIVQQVGSGFKDSTEDIKNVMTGKYTIFSGEYWGTNEEPDAENPMSGLTKAVGFVDRILKAPMAMVGYAVSKVIDGAKVLISGAKEGITDASSDVLAVAKGQYTIFSKDYWKSDNENPENPLSGIGSVISFITRLFSAPKAMMGYAVSKLVQGFKALASGAKEGVMDAAPDVLAVTKGQYTIFNGEYWKSDNEDPENPLSGIGSVIGFITRLFSAPKAMMGWSISKLVQGFKTLVSGAKEGVMDASSDISAVAKGQYTIFNGDYWKSDNEDPDNPLSGIGSVIGFITRLFSAPRAMMGWGISKIVQGFKTLVAGAKEGALDASSDISAVSRGQYTIFSKDYWTSDNEDPENPLSGIGNIMGFVTRLFSAPKAMMGWTVTKAVQGLKALVSGAKEGLTDASTDISAVARGQYTIFSSQYWKSNSDDPENPLSGIGNIIGFVTRLFSAPKAMMGYAVTKVVQGLKAMVSGAKEGLLDASADISAVATGQYTIFSADYWKSNEDDPENPMSGIGNIFGFITRLFSAPKAMMGYAVSKVVQGFKAMIEGAKEGALDASSDVAAVKKGEYTVFSKDYWTSDEEDPENPLSGVGQVFGVVTRLIQAPGAMLGYVMNKVGGFFTKMIDGAKDVQKDTDAAVQKAKDGKISVFGSEYWKIKVDEDNPLGVVGKVMGFIQRLINAPVVLITNAFKGIKDMLGGVWDWFKGLLGMGRASSGGYSGAGRAAPPPYYGGSRADEPQPYLYQRDREIGKMKYGDSTIAKSGCAPVAATNLLNEFNNGSSLNDAMQFAERNKMVAKGGTNIGYFNAYLGSKGIRTRNTDNKEEVLNALRSGNKVVLLGQDRNNNPGAPFGTNPHFVTASEMDSYGNIVVNDPDLGPVMYGQDMLNSMIKGVVAENPNIKQKRSKSTSGRGRARSRLMRLFGGARVMYEITDDSANSFTKATPYTAYTGGTNTTPTNSTTDTPTNSVQYTISNVIKNNGAGLSAIPKGTKLSADVILAVARNELDVSEYPHKNQVKYNNAYYGRTNAYGDSYAWCVVFIWWVFQQAGAAKAFCGGAKEAGCWAVYNYYNKLGKYDKKNAKPGDIGMVIWNGEPKAHVTIIESVNDDGTYTCIDGNWGDKVQRVTRKINDFDGFCHVDYPYEFDPSSIIDMSKWNVGGDDTGMIDPNSITTDGSNAGETIFTKLGKLGESVFKAMYGKEAYEMLFGKSDSATSSTTTGNLSGTTLSGANNEEKIYNYLRQHGYTHAGTAGLMGNLYAESGLVPNNLENKYENQFGMTDQQYTDAVNSGTRNKQTFTNDKAGYGLGQWTWHTRKAEMHDHLIGKGLKIDDLGGQLGFLTHEMGDSYSGVDNFLKSTNDYNAASDKVLYDFENPANKESAKPKRRQFAKNYYDKYKGVVVNGNMDYGSGRAHIANARTMTGPYTGGGGSATRALTSNIRYADTNIGGATMVDSTHHTTTTSSGIDYQTFLQTIVTILLKISDNTALLTGILDILSKNFNLDIDKEKLAKAAVTDRAKMQEALNEVVKNSVGSSDLSTVLNSRDNQYLLNAMAAIAKE